MQAPRYCASLGCSKHMLMFNVTCSIMDSVRRKGASLPPISILTTCWWIQFLLLNPAVKIVPTLFLVIHVAVCKIIFHLNESLTRQCSPGNAHQAKPMHGSSKRAWISTLLQWSFPMSLTVRKCCFDVCSDQACLRQVSQISWVFFGLPENSSVSLGHCFLFSCS